MIRKDQLPDIWGDEWKMEASLPTLFLAPAKGETVRIVATDEGWIADSLKDKVKAVPSVDKCELRIAEGADVEFYRIQGINTPERHLTDTIVTMERGSRLRMCTVTLGGRHVRNNIVVRMQGEGCTLEADGLYLIDREQQCDNYIFVEHAMPRCTSRELYKGIIDERARARFNGHVLVQDGSVKTEAYMTNRNILLTDKAHVDTRPFLEIYNDDVKCSHGSTIGQLDEQAKFYLQTRGISERTAITMLSYAFCDEVVRGIGMPELREIVGDMVKKRLHGELPCDECAIRCSTPCNGEAANFHIDPSKL